MSDRTGSEQRYICSSTSNQNIFSSRAEKYLQQPVIIMYLKVQLTVIFVSSELR